MGLLEEARKRRKSANKSAEMPADIKSMTASAKIKPASQKITQEISELAVPGFSQGVKLQGEELLRGKLGGDKVEDKLQASIFGPADQSIDLKQMEAELESFEVP